MRTKSAHGYETSYYARAYIKSLQTVVVRIPNRIIRGTGQLVFIGNNKLIDGQGFTERGTFCRIASVNKILSALQQTDSRSSARVPGYIWKRASACR